jgi:hypothetical protein
MQPDVSLNHFYLLLNQAAFQSVRDCDFLRREFAVGEERTTLANSGDTWTGIYFYGQNTYFEFLDASVLRLGGAPGPIAPGGVGLALGTETAGATAALLGHLQGLGRPLASGLRTRRFQDQDLPWFYCSPMQIFRGNHLLTTWLMEYHPNFLPQWRPELAPNTPQIDRAAVLAKYQRAVVGPGELPPRLLRDVAYLRLALPPTVAEQAADQLASYGGTLARGLSGWQWQAQDFWLEIAHASDPAHQGLREVGFLLHTGPAVAQPVAAGVGNLVLGPGPIATWTF